MFMASHSKEVRARKILGYLARDPGVSLLLAAVNFEWTVGRAMLFLSGTPNSKQRVSMKKCHGLKAYEDLWAVEVALPRKSDQLSKIVANWAEVRDAFNTRHLLVHGRDGVTKKMAVPHVQALIEGASHIDEYCERLGFALSRRMPVRKKGSSEESGQLNLSRPMKRQA